MNVLRKAEDIFKPASGEEVGRKKRAGKKKSRNVKDSYASKRNENKRRKKKG